MNVTELASRNDREDFEMRARQGARTSGPGSSAAAVRPAGIAPKMDLGDYEEHKNDDPVA